MQPPRDLGKIQAYFAEKLKTHGATPAGVDYNSLEAQEIRFGQLLKIIDARRPYALLDYGSGFGSLFDFLRRLGHSLDYYGYDLVPEMVARGRELHLNEPACHFTTRWAEVPQVDYALSCGTFNLKMDFDEAAWTTLVLEALHQMDECARKGFAFNLLTKYSEVEKMRPHLYYGDPLFFFDYCKRNFSKNVALLHDYQLYDFTILVRKD